MENISKIVVSVDDGLVIGYVLDVVLNNFEKTGYVVVEDETENEYLLKRENILSISEEYVLIENISDLEFLVQKESSIIGREVLGEDGFSFGKVEGLKFEKNKFVKIITKKMRNFNKIY